MRTLLALFSFLLAGLASAQAVTAPVDVNARRTRVMIVHSYDAGHPSARVFSEGLYAALGEDRRNLEFTVEHLDGVRYPGRLQEFRDYLTVKLLQRPPDYVIVTGSVAFDLVMKMRDGPLANKPILHSFVIPQPPEALSRLSGTSGVALAPDYSTNFKLIQKLLPNTKRLIIYGKVFSPTALRNVTDSVTTARSFFPEAEFWPEPNIDKVLARLKALPKDTVLFGIAWQFNSAGDLIEPPEAERRMEEQTGLAAFSPYDYAHPDAVIGGFVNSMYDQGHVIGERLLALVGGADINNMPRQNIVPGRYQFSWSALRRFHIDEAQLPPGSTVVGRPPSLRESNPGAFYGGIMALVVLTSMVLALIAVLRIRHKAGVQLAASEARHRLLFEDNPTPLLAYDIDSLTVLVANPACAVLFGRDDAALIDMPVEALIHAPQRGAMRQSIAQRAASDELIHWQSTGVRGDGHSFDLESWSRATRIGRHRARIVMVQDVSARVAAEAAILDLNVRLTALLDAAREVAIVATDAEGRITVFNRGAERMLGYAMQEVLGQTPERFHLASEIHQRAGELASQLGYPVAGYAAVTAPARHGESDIRNWTYVRKDGAHLHVSLAVSATRDKQGNITGFLGIARDITEQLNAEAKLLQINQTLEERIAARTADLSRANEELTSASQQAKAADRAKSVFLASMSHELRTPLNAILGFSQLLRHQANISPAQRKTLDLINRSGENLLNLINDVLDMSKIEAGGMAVDKAVFNLHAMAADIIDLMTGRAEAKGLRLVLDPASTYAHFVCGDAAKLRQCVLNLIGNAIKFTRQGQVVLRVNTTMGETAEQIDLIIDVVDSGVGISAEDQVRVFEPFVQVGRQDTQKGTGLGLSITRKFVELMGGSLSLESAVGKGSCFRLQVPVTVGEDDASGAQCERTGRVVALAPGQPTYRILIVEDQMENSLLLQTLLEDVGLDVRVAENGLLGVEAFESWRPHFIWMDNRMPVMDGITATQRIRALPGGKDVKIAAVTASAFKDEHEQVLAAGVDDFIIKPYRQDEVFGALARHLGLVFIREDDATPAQAEQVPPAELTAADFAALADDLRHGLRTAAEEMNQGKLAAALAGIEARAPALAAGIDSMVRAFRFRELCELLDAAGQAAQ